MELIEEFEPTNLYESNYCRLCCEKNNSSINVFEEQYDNQFLFTLINSYLPITVQDDGKHPQTICPGCHIQLQAIISFFDLLKKGQRKLREMLDRKVNPHISPDNPGLEAHLGGKKPLYGIQHKLHQKTFGAEKLNTKRSQGRPRKSILTNSAPTKNVDGKNEKNNVHVGDGLPKRTRKFPARLGETVNGKELEDIYLEEGLITPNEREAEEVIVPEPEVIGHVKGETGEGLCEVIQTNIQHFGPKPRIALQFRCDVCGAYFTHEAKLHKHHAEVHGGNFNDKVIEPSNNTISYPVLNEDKLEKKNRCGICNKKFRLASSLKGHMLSRHSTCVSGDPVNIYPCDSCDKKFAYLSSLSYHREAEHSNGKLYACNKCDKTFKHKQLLRRHQSVHSDVRPYFCDKCDSSFKTKANLINHETSHSKEKKFICSICGHVFAYKNSLTLHIRSHSGKKPFECATCQKKFTQKGNLKEHIRTHTGEKPYKCQVCARNFTTSSQFKLHCKRHLGFKPWNCEYCEKSFLHKNTWLCHLRRHRGEKPYKCKECTKTFPELWALKKHNRIHTGEKPYSCLICKKTFADCSNLKKHKLMHVANEQKKTEAKVKIKNADGKIQGETNGGNEQLWTIISGDDNIVDINDTSDQQIIYVAYSNSNDNNIKLSQKVLISKDELEKITANYSSDEEEIEDQEENANELDGVFVPAVQVLDESGRPLKFASDGTLFQVTTMDGEPLQVTLDEDEADDDSDGYSLAIGADGKPIIHQIKPMANVSMVGAMDEGITVTSRTTEPIGFVPDDSHLKLISELNAATLNIPAEYLEMVQ